MKSDEIISYYAIKYYFEAMQVMDNHTAAMGYIYTLFDKNIAKKVDDYFVDPEKILIKQYGNIPKNKSSAIKIKENVKRTISLYRQKNVLDQTLISSVM